MLLVSYGGGGWRHIKSWGKSRVVGFSKTHNFVLNTNPLIVSNFFGHFGGTMGVGIESTFDGLKYTKKY